MIDDEIYCSKTIIRNLEVFYKYSITYCSHVNQVLNLTKEELNHYDVIILDIMMPISDELNDREIEEANNGISLGIVLLRRIRNMTLTPIILYTSRGDVEYLAEDERFISYIKKPVLTEELHKEILNITKHSS